jgi:fumarate hydratase class I
VIYYVGPVDPVREEIVGPAGPTTATRMDSFMRHDARTRPARLRRQGRTRPAATQSIAKHKSRLSDGGGRCRLSRRPRDQGRKVVGFADLGMEAIYEFDVKDMPVTVAVDSSGDNVHQTAPLIWKKKIAEEGLLVPAPPTPPHHCGGKRSATGVALD